MPPGYPSRHGDADADDDGVPGGRGAVRPRPRRPRHRHRRPPRRRPRQGGPPLHGLLPHARRLEERAGLPGAAPAGRLRPLPAAGARQADHHGVRRGLRHPERRGRDRGRAPPLHAPLLPRHVGRAPGARHAAHHRRAELPVRVGARPPPAPPLQRHARRPAQRAAWLLLLARGLAHDAQAPGRHRARPHHRPVRPGARPHRHVPEALLQDAVHLLRHPAARVAAAAAVGRAPRRGAVRLLLLPHDRSAQHHVARQQRRAHVRHAPLQQEHGAGGVRGGGVPVAGRGLAQLPPLLPLGLPRGRAGLPPRLLHAGDRLDGAARLGERPQVRERVAGAQARAGAGRRLARAVRRGRQGARARSRARHARGDARQRRLRQVGAARRRAGGGGGGCGGGQGVRAGAAQGGGRHVAQLSAPSGAPSPPLRSPFLPPAGAAPTLGAPPPSGAHPVKRRSLFSSSAHPRPGPPPPAGDTPTLGAPPACDAPPTSIASSPSGALPLQHTSNSPAVPHPPPPLHPPPLALLLAVAARAYVTQRVPEAPAF